MLLDPICPPVELMGKYFKAPESLKVSEQSEVVSHLEECESCRRIHAGDRRPDRSRPLAWVATGLFGALGLTVVLLVSFRHTRPLTENPKSAAPSMEQRVVQKPLQNTLTSVERTDNSGE